MKYVSFQWAGHVKQLSDVAKTTFGRDSGRCRCRDFTHRALPLLTSFTTHLHIHEYIHHRLEGIAIALLLVRPAWIRFDMRIAARTRQIDHSQRHWIAGTQSGHHHKAPFVVSVDLKPHRYDTARFVPFGRHENVLRRFTRKVDRVSVDSIDSVHVFTGFDIG